MECSTNEDGSSFFTSINVLNLPQQPYNEDKLLSELFQTSAHFGDRQWKTAPRDPSTAVISLYTRGKPQSSPPPSLHRDINKHSFGEIAHQQSTWFIANGQITCNTSEIHISVTTGRIWTIHTSTETYERAPNSQRLTHTPTATRTQTRTRARRNMWRSGSRCDF